MSTSTLAADPGSRAGSAVRAARQVNRPGLALFVICAVQLLMVMDVTIVNIALPAIGAELGLSLQQVSWTVTAYAITFGGLLMAGGRIADVFGRRRILIIGTVLFAAASVMAGLAQGQALLVVARALQGLAAALASPASLALIPAVFPRPEQRSRAMAVYAAMAGIGAVAGLVLGGILTQSTSWRWVFFVGAPMAALIVVLAPVVLPAPAGSRKKLSGSSAVTVTTGIAALVYAVTTAPADGWGGAQVVRSLGLAVVALACFAALEARRSVPLLPRAHLRDAGKLVTWAVMFVVGGGMLSTLFFTTHLLQSDRGYGPFEAGISFVPTNVSMIVGSQIAARLIGRIGAWRLIAAGALLSGIGAALLSTADAADSYAAGMLPALVLSGLGFGLMFVSVVIVAMKGAQPHEAGVISGLTSTMQQVGGAVGVAVLIGVATTGHGPGASLDPRIGFVILATGFGAIMLTAITMWLRARGGEPARNAEALQISSPEEFGSRVNGTSVSTAIPTGHASAHRRPSQ